MKNQILILIALIIVTFSCKKDEPIAPAIIDYNNEVIGNYQVLRLELNGKIAILPTATVSAGISVKSIGVNKVSTTLTVISTTGKVVYNFVNSDVKKDDVTKIITLANPNIATYDQSKRSFTFSSVTDAGELVKGIAVN